MKRSWRSSDAPGLESFLFSEGHEEFLMNHNGGQVILLNLFAVGAFLLLWGMGMPGWTFFAIALPVSLLLIWLTIDPYGGMYLVTLILPGLIMATSNLIHARRDAVEAEVEQHLGYVILQFFGTVIGGVLILVVIMASGAGIAIGLDWIRDRRGAGLGRDFREEDADDKESCS